MGGLSRRRFLSGTLESHCCALAIVQETDTEGDTIEVIGSGRVYIPMLVGWFSLVCVLGRRYDTHDWGQ